MYVATKAFSPFSLAIMLSSICAFLNDFGGRQCKRRSSTKKKKSVAIHAILTLSTYFVVQCFEGMGHLEPPVGSRAGTQV